MRKLILKFTFAFFLFVVVVFKPSFVHAVIPISCSEIRTEGFMNGEPIPDVFTLPHGLEELTIRIIAHPSTLYRIHFSRYSTGAHTDDGCNDYETPFQITNTEGEVTFRVSRSDFEGLFRQRGLCNLVRIQLQNSEGDILCRFGKYLFGESSEEDELITGCDITMSSLCPDINTTFNFWVRGLNSTETYQVYYNRLRGGSSGSLYEGSANSYGAIAGTAGPFGVAGDYELVVATWDSTSTPPWVTRCAESFTVLEYNPDPSTCPEGFEPGAPSITLLRPERCVNCLRVDPHCSAEQVQTNPLGCCLDWEEDSEGIQTALGCFPTQPAAIVEWIINFAMMLAGGIGFLLMLYASFQIMTSGGDPEKLQEGKQLLGAAISGILLIVFSLFILRFIGATVLRIPGWQ